MAGLILNKTDLNPNAANHTRNCQNDDDGMFGEMIVENIDGKRNKKHTNDATNTVITTSDINSNQNSADELNYPKKSETEVSTTNGRTEHRTSSGSNNNRSITLGHHHNDDSSVFDSSSEADSDFDDIMPSSSSIMVMDKKLDTAMHGHSSIMCANNDINPSIGNVAIQNSTDITFGNKTYYQGPVTIKQFVIRKDNWKETELSSSPENVNLGLCINLHTIRDFFFFFDYKCM